MRVVVVNHVRLDGVMPAPGEPDDAGGPHKDGLNDTLKYVASADPPARLPWPNSQLVLGSGQTLFAATDNSRALELVNSGATSTGVILATHRA